MARRLLLLGGTTEARRLAQRLHRAGVDFVYSLAGVTSARPLPFVVRRGGFGGAAGLSDWLRREQIDLLVDASHPYAAGISRNAALAGARCGVPVWRWQRPVWRPGDGDDWHPVSDWPQAAGRLSAWQRPLLTLGTTPLRQPFAVPQGAHWLLRCMPGWHGPLQAGSALIRDGGPFTVARERRLFAEHAIDVLVSRNSGGAAVAAKLQVCRERALPVLMLERPSLPPVLYCVDDIDQLFCLITEWI